MPDGAGKTFLSLKVHPIFKNFRKQKKEGEYNPRKYTKKSKIDPYAADFQHTGFIEGLISFDDPMAGPSDMNMSGPSSQPSWPPIPPFFQPPYAVSPCHSSEMVLDPALFDDSTSQLQTHPEPNTEGCEMSFHMQQFPQNHPGVHMNLPT